MSNIFHRGQNTEGCIKVTDKISYLFLAGERGGHDDDDDDDDDDDNDYENDDDDNNAYVDDNDDDAMTFDTPIKLSYKNNSGNWSLTPVCPQHIYVCEKKYHSHNQSRQNGIS